MAPKVLGADFPEKAGASAAVGAVTSGHLRGLLRSADRSVRWLARGSRAWMTFRHGSRPHRVVWWGGRAIARYILMRPRLAQRIRRLLQRFPALEKRLRATPVLYFVRDVQRVEFLSDLSPRARSVYVQLQAAIARREPR